MRPAIASGIEIRTKIPHGVECPEQRHRQRPRQEERAERVDMNNDELDRIGPAPASCQWGASFKDGDDSAKNEHGCHALGDERRDRSMRVVSEGEGEDRPEDQRAAGEEKCRHGQRQPRAESRLNLTLRRRCALTA